MKTFRGAKKNFQFPPPGSAALAWTFKKPYPLKTANPVIVKLGDFFPPCRGHLVRFL